MKCKTSTQRTSSSYSTSFPFLFIFLIIFFSGLFVQIYFISLLPKPPSPFPYATTPTYKLHLLSKDFLLCVPHSIAAAMVAAVVAVCFQFHYPESNSKPFLLFSSPFFSVALHTSTSSCTRKSIYKKKNPSPRGRSWMDGVIQPLPLAQHTSTSLCYSSCALVC